MHFFTNRPLLKYGALTISVFLLLATIGALRFVHLSSFYEPGDKLSLVDKAIVYSGHATMVAGGYAVGYREVAAEAFYLHVPGPDRREWYSCFPSRSPLVQEGQRKVKQQIRSGAPHGTARVSWHGYKAATQRWSLALNSMHLVGKPNGEDILYLGVVEISYPEQSNTLIETSFGLSIPLEEGLYRALEKEGWLHPYVAHWYWKESVCQS